MKRHLILIAMLALIAAGCRSTPSEESSSPAGDAAPDTTGRMDLVLARVGDKDITGEDLRTHFAKALSAERADAYIGNPDAAQVGLASLVDQFVWAGMARKAGIKLTRSEAHQVAAMEAQFLARRYVAEVVQPKAKPSRAEVEEFYTQHQSDFIGPQRAAVRHILVSEEADARRLVAEARAGADFAGLAKRYSQDAATRDVGGTLGYVQKDSDIIGIGRDGFFIDKVLSMSAGDVDMVKTAYGWHVVRVEKKEGGDLLPLDEVYAKIEEPLLKQRYGTIYNDDLTQAREKVGVKYETKNFERFVGVPDNCERLMAAASQQPSEASQVELYRRVSSDFPDCQQAPEAQFMVGYIHLVKLNNQAAALKALTRLQKRFPDSDWAKAGKYLLEHLDDDPASLGTPAEVYAKGTL